MSTGVILPNNSLIADLTSKYWLYFSDNFGSINATLINDSNGHPITGYISGRTSIYYDFDYSGNTQEGRIPNTDVDFTAVAIGQNIARYSIIKGVITSGLTNIILTSDTDWNYSGNTQGTSGTSGIDGENGTSGASGSETLELTITGVQDGINKNFILSSGVSYIHMFYVDGQLQTYNNDYYVSGLTLTFIKIPPKESDILRLFITQHGGVFGTSGTDGT